MDPMDYVLHNHPRSAAHYDPVHAASGPWMPHPHPQPSPAYPWQSHPSSMAQPFSHHPLQPAPMPGSDPFQLAANGGLPPPVPGFHGGPGPDSFPNPMPPRHFHASVHRMSAPLPGLPPNHLSAMNDGAFVNQAPGGRALGFPPPVGLGMPPASTNLEPNSLPRPPFPLSDFPANGFAQHHTNPHFGLPQPALPGSFNSTPPRRTHFSSSSISSSSPSSRSLREVQSPTRSSQSASNSRRSHPRARRSMSSRFLNSDAGRDDEDELARQFFVEHLIHTSGRSDASMDQQSVDDAILRQMQLVRGISTKQVASKMTLRSLQSVNIEDLPETERTCVICYNDYGMETPEGINEAPLRLPKCKHVFGDHCIKKWFEESDSCPYCRDKLHSEPKQHGTSARAFMNMMRMRGINVPPGLAVNADEVLVRAMTSPSEAEPISSAPRQNPTTGRRSPPDDAGEQQRRTRPRHSTSDTQIPTSPSRTATFEQASPSTPERNASGAAFPRSQRHSASRGAVPAQRRGWAPGPILGAPGGNLPETSRRPGLAQPSTSMSPSAPTFYPRGGLENSSRTPAFFNTLGGPQPDSPSRLPNPLQSPINLTQGGQQQEMAGTSAPRPTMASVGSVPGGDQVSPVQNIRNRPW